MSTTRHKIIAKVDISNMKNHLPKSWHQAAGMLRGKRKDLEMHIKKIRREWNQCMTIDTNILIAYLDNDSNVVEALTKYQKKGGTLFYQLLQKQKFYPFLTGM